MHSNRVVPKFVNRLIALLSPRFLFRFLQSKRDKVYTKAIITRGENFSEQIW